MVRATRAGLSLGAFSPSLSAIERVELKDAHVNVELNEDGKPKVLVSILGAQPVATPVPGIETDQATGGFSTKMLDKLPEVSVENSTFRVTRPNYPDLELRSVRLKWSSSDRYLLEFESRNEALDGSITVNMAKDLSSVTVDGKAKVAKHCAGPTPRATPWSSAPLRRHFQR